VECGVRSNRHKSRLPDAALFLADRAVVIDHSNDDVYVLALFQSTTSTRNESSVADRNGSSVNASQNGHFSQSAEPSNGAANGCVSKLNGSLNGHGCSNKTESWPPVLNREKSAAEEWVATTLKRISNLGKSGVDLASERRQSSQFSSVIDTGKEKFTPPFTLEKSRTTYINDVNECKRYIYDGESYEVCLTTQLRRETHDLDTLGLYLTLRKTNPAPYASWLHFGEHGPQVCCSSPERFLRLDRGGILEAKPIKGTLPRGISPAEDERLRFELQHRYDHLRFYCFISLLSSNVFLGHQSL
jgi:para-aminobenzoate synthetase